MTTSATARKPMGQFFSKYVGPTCAKRVEIDVHDHPALRAYVTIDFDGENREVAPLHLTPEQAKQIGRALIKAAKNHENSTR